MANKWTSAQEKAIKAKGATLVSASAGTGKTAVLTEKVFQSVMHDNIPIDKMLVMTFSNAAASEMAERIKAKFISVMQDKENTTKEDRKKAYVQVKKFSMTKIETIHAFCKSIVKEYFYKVGVDANFETISNFDACIMKQNIVDTILESEYLVETPEFVQLEELIDGSTTLENVLIECYDKIRTFINPMGWLHEAVEKYNVTTKEIPSYIQDMISDDLKTAISYMEVALAELEGMNDKKMEKNAEIIKADIEIVRTVLGRIEAGDVNAITENTFSQFGAIIRFPSKDDSFENIKKNRNAGKDIICDSYKNTNFNLVNQLSRIRIMHSAASKFEELIKKIDEMYTALKKENKVIDFNDMEKYAYEILQDEAIAVLVSNKFAKVFVDEYQDTNPIQEAIINKVARKNNLFCVGDMKQSIYRFRASDPLLFQRRSKDYKENAKHGEVIALNSNFRSTQNVLDCANDVFNHITKCSNEITYSTDDKLIHGREDDGACNTVVVNLISELAKDKYAGKTAEEIEVYNIVDTINNIIGKDIYDQETNSYRPATYKDIVILSRKLTGLSDIFSQIFSANNIPFVIDKAGELLKSVEAQAMMNVLELAINPQNDIKLIAFVHEGFFGFTDDDMMAIRCFNIKNSFYDNFMAIAKEETELSAKCKRTMQFLANCKAKEEYCTIPEIMDYIVNELNFYDFFAVASNAEKRIANIEQMFKRAKEYSTTYNNKLLGFVKYIKKINDSPELVEEGRTNFSENSVTITTIHKSKGLEYPVVILSFMSKGFSTIDKRTNILIDKDAGLGLRFYDAFEKCKGKTLMRTYVEKVVSDKSIEEEMRLLYVAMTRAKEKLFIQGIVPAEAKPIDLDNAKSMMEWILSTLSTGKAIDDTTIEINGKWSVVRTMGENLEKYIESNAHVVSNEDFNRTFPNISKPVAQPITKKEEAIPVYVSSSKVGSNIISESNLIVPTFGENNFTALDIGTVTHLFFKSLDFKGDLSEMGLNAQRDIMVANNVFTEVEASKINIHSIAKFFETSFGQKMASADEYIRELSMVSNKKAKDILGGDSDAEVLVRCVVDIIFKKDGLWHIADYKTDTFDVNSSKDVELKVAEHAAQLNLYAEIYSKIYGVEIATKNVIFVNQGVAFDVDNNEH